MQVARPTTMRQIFLSSRGLLVLGLWLAPMAHAAPSGPTTPATAAKPEAWPRAGAALVAPEIHFPKGFGKKRVYLDAGHGVGDNHGNSSVTCEDEEQFTLRVAQDLAARLEATGHFHVRLSRKSGQEVSYRSRLKAAEAWGADAFVSIHSDARGMAIAWAPEAGKLCYRQDGTPGFSILWSDAGPRRLIARRHELARALARRMEEAGFLPYDGVDYPGLYDGDPEQAGVFVDRHQPGQRIYFLRKPPMPSTIIETHHALDFEEAARWREPRTLEVFAATVAAGLVDVLAPRHGDGPRQSSSGASNVGEPSEGTASSFLK